MRSLYRDAFRRIIIPWLFQDPMPIELQIADEKSEILRRMRGYHVYSVTESFNHKEFENANALAGLPKPTVLGERLSAIPSLVARSVNVEGLIVLEDLMGSGSQAARVLKAVDRSFGGVKRMIFVPLIAIERGVNQLDPFAGLTTVTVRPVLTVPRSRCCADQPSNGEPEVFARLRSIVKATKDQACAAGDEFDERPDDPFGFSGTGATIVSHQNTPNNTLPIIHHKSASWEPLFRRLHHSYGKQKK